MPTYPPPKVLSAILKLVLLVLAAPLVLLLIPSDAKANVVCLIDNAEMDFGTSSVGAGTIDYTCTNYSFSPRNFTLCVDLGNPSWPGNRRQPELRSGNNFVDYQVFEDAGLSQVWTAQDSLTKTVSMPPGMASRVSGSFQFYGAIASGQSPRPGNYQAFFYNMVLGTPNNGGQCKTSGIGGSAFSAQQFTLDVRANIVNDCRIVATGDADLGSVSAGAGAVAGVASISVNCPTGTAYNIGLQPSNGSSAGTGLMTGTHGNSDTLVYQLRTQGQTGPVWGNTASISSQGNGVSGTGNGSDQQYPVYVTVPYTDVAPDTYRDTVRVTVHF